MTSRLEAGWPAPGAQNEQKGAQARGLGSTLRVMTRLVYVTSEVGVSESDPR